MFLLRSTRTLRCLKPQTSSPIIIIRGLRTPPGSRPAIPKQPNQSPPDQQAQPVNHDVSSLLSDMNPSENQLLAPVHIPEDPKAVLKSDHPATSLLAQSGLVVTRQVEMMNIFLGFEQANRYVIMDPQGNHVGYMAETDGGIGTAMTRQWLRTHRAFTTNVFDKHGQEVLRFQRPFSLINTRIRIFDPLEVGKHAPRNDITKEISTDVKDTAVDGINSVSTVPLEAMRVIGEVQSEWAPLRRKYNLFLAHELEAASIEAIDTKPVPSDLSIQQKEQARRKQTDSFAQFAYVNEPFLSWDFSLKGADDRLIGSVNRQFRGFGREIFTDTGMYMLRMDSAALESEAQQKHVISQSHQGERAYAEAVGGSDDKIGMTLDQRAIMLATAVTVDFDYFSRQSRAGGGMFMPMWMMGGGGGEAAGGAAGGAVGGAAGAEGGAVVGGAAGRGVAGTAAEVGAGEGAIAGAGSLAGYEAMQRGMGRNESAETPPSADSSSGSADPNSPQYGGDYDYQTPQDGSGGQQQDGDTWGAGDSDPWANQAEGGGGGGESGEGGLWSTLWDSFFGD